jgi:hypothetical protein
MAIVLVASTSLLIFLPLLSLTFELFHFQQLTVQAGFYYALWWPPPFQAPFYVPLSPC